MANVTRLRPNAEYARWLDVGVAGRALPGEARSGDRAVVQPFHGGVLVAAVDGLGHGSDAADAAEQACAVLERHTAEPPLELIRRCHAALAETRGVAMSLAVLTVPDRTLTWVAVGNVEGAVWQQDPSGRPVRTGLVTRGGVVGVRLPGLQTGNVPVARGDLLVFATDGVAPDFADVVQPKGSPQAIADDILQRYGRPNDDALVVAARILMGS